MQQPSLIGKIILVNKIDVFVESYEPTTHRYNCRLVGDPLISQPNFATPYILTVQQMNDARPIEILYPPPVFKDLTITEPATTRKLRYFPGESTNSNTWKPRLTAPTSDSQRVMLHTYTASAHNESVFEADDLLDIITLLAEEAKSRGLLE